MAIRTAANTVFGTITISALLIACQDPARSAAPSGTPLTRTTEMASTAGSGSVSTLLGRATFAEAFKVKRQTDKWDVEIKAHNPIDIAVQTINFAAGSYSGWHRHPGPVFIQVVSGTMRFYESDDPTCTPVERTAGQGFLDTGDHAHIARNETDAPAVNVVTYFAPPGAALRIDAPTPGNCPF